MTETEAAAQEYAVASALKVLFSDKRDKNPFRAHTSRFRGKDPDAYETMQLGIYLAYMKELDKVAMRDLEGLPPDGGVQEPEWTKYMEHPILTALEDVSVSMGGGKGRKEGVELGKVNPPQAPRSRFSWRRHE